MILSLFVERIQPPVLDKVTWYPWSTIGLIEIRSSIRLMSEMTSAARFSLRWAVAIDVVVEPFPNSTVVELLL